MKNQPILKLLTLVFGLVMLSACQTATAPAPTATPTPSPWIDVILNDPDCTPPCWNGITPGVTTMDEAWAIMQAEPGLIDLVYHGGETSVAYFDWTFSDVEGRGSVYSSKIDYSTVYYIYFDPTNIYDILSLEEAIEYFGEPDIFYYWPRHSFLAYETKLYYPERGIDMDVSYIPGPWYAKKRIEVLPDNVIWSICFSRPFPRDEDNSYWQDWEGYGIYKFEEGWIGE